MDDRSGIWNQTRGIFLKKLAVAIAFVTKEKILG